MVERHRVPLGREVSVERGMVTLVSHTVSQISKLPRGLIFKVLAARKTLEGWEAMEVKPGFPCDPVTM